jgi:hypothetical protein
VPVKSFLLTGTSDSHSSECVIPDDVLIQFGPPDDKHLLLETCRGINKYIKKECIELVITQNCIKMHGQQNIKYLEDYYHTRFHIHTLINLYGRYIGIISVR